MFLYRCRNCSKREAKKKRVEEYKRVQKCKDCGHELRYLDKWQMKKNKETTCKCDGVSYPHRIGSIVWCKFHKTGPSEKDYQDRYGD